MPLIRLLLSGSNTMRGQNFRKERIVREPEAAEPASGSHVAQLGRERFHPLRAPWRAASLGNLNLGGPHSSSIALYCTNTNEPKVSFR